MRALRPLPPSLALALALLCALALSPRPAAAQEREGPSAPQEWIERCRDGHWGGERERFCEIRDSELPGSLRRLTVDGRRNGGIAVRGWTRTTILVRAKIQTHGRSEEAARERAAALRVRTDGGRIEAESASDESGDWSVSYEIWVPRAGDYDLQLDAYNGGVRVADVGGRIRVETHNGGLRLDNVAGDVRARTQNGGVDVVLTGRQWSGAGLDVQTRNGGVRLDIPDGYNAQLETGTVNGGMRVDVPVTVQGRIGRSLSARLGSGGPTVRVTTTNGGVTVRRS